MNADIAGRLRLFPGQGLPAISSSRPALAARVAAGRSAEALPALMGALHSLCAVPHRLASTAAVAAARGRPQQPSIEDRQLLRATQAREQMLRIAHDWARLWPGGGGPRGTAPALDDCPLWQAGLSPAAQMDAMPQWLRVHWLKSDPQAWLAAHQRDPESWAAHWCEGASGPLGCTLAALRDDAMRLATPHQPLLALVDVERELPALAQRMLNEAGYCAQPEWQGRTADTGPWTRLHDAQRHAARTAWHRLLSRVADLLQLAAPGGERWLSQGGLVLGAGLGLAWVEMARGLLVHVVALEPGFNRVAACRVLAPTEWNCHPHGGLAQALSNLQGEGAGNDARRLAVAYDPCVEFDIAGTAERELAHA